jgi:threonine synthase
MNKLTKTFRYYCYTCHHTGEYTNLMGRCPTCGGDWLEPVYDLATTAQVWEDQLSFRDQNIWRYWELLPLRDQRHIVSLGEGWTPLLQVDNLGAMLGHRNVFIKDERQGPTASFKDRQASIAVSAMKEADVKETVVASTGNVAISYSAYCARSGIKLWAFLDSNVPHEKIREVMLYGTEVIKVSGNYDTTKQVAAKFAEHRHLFLDKGIKSLTAREAMKTLAFEVAEQLGRVQGRRWAAPDWYIQAVSGGMGPIGVWHGFKELYDMGFIAKMPKLAIIQTDGCAPMVDSFHKGLETSDVVTNPTSLINVLATGNPGPAYPYLRRLILTYGGSFVKVDDQEAFKALRVMAQLEGLSMEPAAAVACAGLIKMIQQHLIQPDEIVVVNASGHTFPIEKQILENEIVKSHTRVQSLERHVVETVEVERKGFQPDFGRGQEGLLKALERLDDRIQSIAIIEDEPDVRLLLRRILQQKRQYQVFEAVDGASGLQLVRSTKPDLILLDLMMPKVDGFKFLDAVKATESLRDIPVIVITAQDLTNQDVQRLSGRVESLLQKGAFMEEDLVDTIQDALE